MFHSLKPQIIIKFSVILLPKYKSFQKFAFHVIFFPCFSLPVANYFLIFPTCVRLIYDVFLTAVRFFHNLSFYLCQILRFIMTFCICSIRSFSDSATDFFKENNGWGSKKNNLKIWLHSTSKEMFLHLDPFSRRCSTPRALLSIFLKSTPSSVMQCYFCEYPQKQKLFAKPGNPVSTVSGLGESNKSKKKSQIS